MECPYCKRTNICGMDYYKVLGVDGSSTVGAIKKAYRRRMHITHPDKHNGNTDKETETKWLNEAYAVLGDPDMRKHYDLCHRPSRARFSDEGNFRDIGGEYHTGHQTHCDRVAEEALCVWCGVSFLIHSRSWIKVCPRCRSCSTCWHYASTPSKLSFCMQGLRGLPRENCGNWTKSTVHPRAQQSTHGGNLL